MAGVIPKPTMRRLHINQAKRTLGELFLVALTGVTVFKFFYVDPRRKRYEEFYQTYDCEAALKRMNDAGLMQSCPKE